MLDVQGLHLRAALFHSLRAFFREQEFLEVDTPIRQKILLPEANIIPIESEGSFLQTSPELCMKRLLAAGCTRIFQICPCFRKEERGARHLEEFTMLEWYRRGEDYHALMKDCQSMVRRVTEELKAVCSPGGSSYQAVTKFDNLVKKKWERLTVKEAFIRYAPVDMDAALRDESFDEILVEYIEPYLGQQKPTILYDYPIELASLARTKPGNSQVAERFELYISGVELANGFSELTDTSEQRKRFHSELELMAGKGKRVTQMPEQFLEDLGKIESAAGIAFGVDRLLMLIFGKKHISAAVAFAPVDLDQ
ncbi:EF-P lysine aminoacylase EpmA [Desulfopila sp. IMCC35008]|uniref:EF-P lysine aminoacylase EpmA n=1 Tax=Desulfopila sp. IMCC35008 TaxID=2653858 RepID=UPI0013D185A0|nr:EF-P lysine aminoacylase EpmA [Desulfopila sp. IMCC35008]